VYITTPEINAPAAAADQGLIIAVSSVSPETLLALTWSKHHAIRAQAYKARISGDFHGSAGNSRAGLSSRESVAGLAPWTPQAPINGSRPAGTVILIAVALIFDFINGFHDAANSIATIVATSWPRAY
jgi:hypothetical protein